MGDQSSATGFSVDTDVFEELRTVYRAILDNVGSARDLIADGGTGANDTGSDVLAANLQQLLRNVNEFLTETGSNLTRDRDGLAAARDNYRAGDTNVSSESRGLFDCLPVTLPALSGIGLTGILSAGTRLVSGPPEQVHTPTRTTR
jgi:hypothetical protein